MLDDNWYAHAALEALIYEQFLAKHPETKELLPIREEIFGADYNSHMKYIDYVLPRIEIAGFECRKDKKYPDDDYYDICKDGKRMGYITFYNKRISMFSCNQ